MEETNEEISNYCDYLKEFLVGKNIAYGDSLQNPNGIFQKDKKGGLLGRIDDKLNRINSVGITDDTEDTVEDLIGYLIHLKIMINRENK